MPGISMYQTKVNKLFVFLLISSKLNLNGAEYSENKKLKVTGTRHKTVSCETSFRSRFKSVRDSSRSTFFSIGELRQIHRKGQNGGIGIL